MLRNRIVTFLCRLAGHPEDVLICPFHPEGIIIVMACVCGQRYHEHV